MKMVLHIQGGENNYVELKNKGYSASMFEGESVGVRPGMRGPCVQSFFHFLE